MVVPVKPRSSELSGSHADQIGPLSDANASDAQSARQKPGCFKRCYRSCCATLTFLNFTKLLSFVAVISALGLIALLLLALKNAGDDKIDTVDDVVEVVAMVALIVTSLILIGGVLNWRIVAAHIAAFESWMFKGAALVHSSVMSLSVIRPSERYAKDQTSLDLTRAGAYSMFITGILFILLGLVGGKTLKEREIKRLKDRKNQKNTEEV